MGQVAFWRLDENAVSTVFADSSGNGLNGVGPRNSSLTYAAGKLAGSYHPNGSTDMIRVTDHSLFSLGSAFTIALWLKTSRMDADRALIGQFDSTLNKRAWLLALAAAGTGGIGYPKIYVSDNGQSAALGHTRSAHAAVALDDGAWHHVVTTFLAGTFGFWIDGTQRSAVIDDNNTVASAYNADCDVTLGGRLANNAIAWPLNGYLDNVRVCNSILNSSQIGYDWNSGNGSSEVQPWPSGSISRLLQMTR
jgi:hypothetical protein